MKGTALVTGGGIRIGRAMALALSEDGYRIALHYNTSKEQAEETAGLIRGRGGECFIIQCDFADRKQVSTLIPRVFEEASDCNVLINNASIFEKGSLRETSDNFLDRHFDINLRTPFILIRDFAHYCRLGNIINIVDTKATRTLTEYFAYTLTKKALVSLTEMAAKDLAPGIRVNGVGPGLTLPPEGKSVDYLKEMSQNVPLQRHGCPDSIVAAVRFILSNELFTGQCIYQDSGEHLK